MHTIDSDSAFGSENRYQSSIVIDCYRLLSVIGLSIDYAWIRTLFPIGVRFGIN